jgi:hypothetical protein
MDVRANAGSKVQSVAPGWIALIQERDGEFDHGLGNVVVIGHELRNGEIIFSLYAHLDDWKDADTLIKEAQRDEGCVQSTEMRRTTCTKNRISLPASSALGRVGASGFGALTYAEYDPHLHLEFKRFAALGPQFNEGNGRNVGYSDHYPNDAYYRDPIEYLHQINSITLLAVRLSESSDQNVPMLMGPGNVRIGGINVDYRRLGTLPTSVELEIIQEDSRTAVRGCGSQWKRLRIASSEDAKFDDETPYKGRIPRYKAVWACGDLLTSIRPPSFLAVSLQPGEVSRLHRVEAGSNGLDMAGPLLRRADNTAVSITDIATHPNGQTFAVSANDLFSVNVATGLLTFVERPGHQRLGN